MKKLFTLLVGVLLGGSAFGQELVINGDLEGEQKEGWSSFWVQDTRNDGPKDADQDAIPHQGEITHSDGVKGWLSYADIVENPFGKGHCVKVHVASQAESEALGTARMENGSYVAWNTQFYLYTTEPMPEGKWIKVEMKVRGSVDGSISSTQAHKYPNGYTYYELFGSVDYEAKKWTKVWKKVQVNSNHVSGGVPFQAICFNLSTSAAESFDLYFDDISVVMSDEEPIQPTVEDTSDWINFMRKGVFSEDPIDFVNYGTDEEPNMVKVSNFMIQVRDPETGGNVLQKAPVVETGDVQFPYAVKVPTLDHYSQTVQIKDLDSEGNEQLDEEGKVLMKDSTTYYWSDGSVIGTSAPARYSSQFFVSTLHKMKSGERYKFVFWAKADKPASLATQAHSLPTKYVGYNTFGSESDFALTTEWQKFELGEPKGNTVPSGANNCQTIAFDCYNLQEANNYYFVFEECSFTEKNVTMSDRTLGTPEDLKLPVNTGDDEEYTTIDAAPMLAAFELEDFSFLNNGKDGIKLLTLTQPEDPEEDPEETFSAILPWTDGGFINEKGYFEDLDYMDGVQLHFDEESIDGSKINIGVWNNPDGPVKFDNGETLKTQLAVSMGGWYYIYNVTLGTAETLAGIAPVKAEKAGNGLIYNLAGQRVDASYKGLVIKDGQKLIQK